MGDYRSSQAELLVRQLAALPGGTAVNVIAKRFPRFGPADAGTGYQQEDRSFSCDAIPETIPMPGGMDEIIITLRGVMNDRDVTEEVRDQLGRMLNMPEIVNSWDSRARFARNEHYYQVTVFTETFCATRPA